VAFGWVVVGWGGFGWVVVEWAVAEWVAVGRAGVWAATVALTQQYREVGQDVGLTVVGQVLV
jgi:hypothetical protein